MRRSPPPGAPLESQARIYDPPDGRTGLTELLMFRGPALTERLHEICGAVTVNGGDLGQAHAHTAAHCSDGGSRPAGVVERLGPLVDGGNDATSRHRRGHRGRERRLDQCPAVPFFEHAGGKLRV